MGGDCNDGNPNVKPGALEVCNSLDDNCDGQTDPTSATGCSNFYPDVDKDGVGANVTPVCYCKATGDWNVNKTGDCNDNDAAVNPGKTEVCNGTDDNCNGQTDENLGMITCGTGACQRTVTNCVGGTTQPCNPGPPSTEVCN
ncbi:MAG: putative metal-binding motif-containing protein, partial [Deltaproteobacteria bacterium]|nr:putative metal-binding motif-containing protein [Deltaproteobacteria bacterium]